MNVFAGEQQEEEGVDKRLLNGGGTCSGGAQTPRSAVFSWQICGVFFGGGELCGKLCDEEDVF